MAGDPAAPQSPVGSDTPAVDEAAVKHHLNRLVGTGLGLAQDQLESQGAFLPVALVLAGDGDIRMLSVAPVVTVSEGRGPIDGEPNDAAESDTAESNAAEPDAAEKVTASGELDTDRMIADLYDLVREQREAFRGAAVVCDVHLPDDGTDAIHIVTEHPSGVTVGTLQPYSRAADGGWIFSEPIWESAAPQIWS